MPRRAKWIILKTGFGPGRSKMGLDTAYRKAIKEMQGITPYVVAAKSGANFEEGKFTIPFFHRSFLVHYPEIKLEEVGSDAPPPLFIQVLLLHYLLNADGTPISGMWIGYRHLPGAFLFERRFTSWALDPLAKAFGNDAQGFRQAGLALGGSPMSRSGDAAFRFLALPKIPMGCILYLGDEEVPASINMLFDAAAPHYLPTEDLSYLGIYLSQALRGSLERKSG
ncbi:MAG: DUF3786 domain-containing protein [Dehalococcoidia bacterium]|nr:DUF3786 domain-containing protein [Chloroflexota bacterium]MCK4242978.1 DUF3786 domain-containing protein [Dehalococcoidia bacterium]